MLLLTSVSCDASSKIFSKASSVAIKLPSSSPSFSAPCAREGEGGGAEGAGQRGGGGGGQRGGRGRGGKQTKLSRAPYTLPAMRYAGVIRWQKVEGSRKLIFTRAQDGAPRGKSGAERTCCCAWSLRRTNDSPRPRLLPVGEIGAWTRSSETTAELQPGGKEVWTDPMRMRRIDEMTAVLTVVHEGG